MQQGGICVAMGEQYCFLITMMEEIEQNVHRIKQAIKVFHNLAKPAASWSNFDWSVFGTISKWFQTVLKSLPVIGNLLLVFFAFYV